VYRQRPLARVVFDRGLRMPAAAQMLSTRDAGPVIIVTTAQGAARAELRKTLEDRGAEIEVAADDTLRAALGCLGARQIGSLVLEGGAELHRAAWSESVADFVQLYVTPHVIGPGGVPFLDARLFSTAALIHRRIEPLGPDVLIEGYVHGPH
jgi:diaminohydroxyphosphoribosylaminopyrimidine deaminase/5-amino-6-(5-phosphoribosylamino)uracil reductase